MDKLCRKFLFFNNEIGGGCLMPSFISEDRSDSQPNKVAVSRYKKTPFD